MQRWKDYWLQATKKKNVKGGSGKDFSNNDV